MKQTELLFGEKENTNPINTKFQGFLSANNNSISYLPLGVILLEKVKSIVREEFKSIGYCEVLLPSVANVKVLKQSKRWDFIKKKIFNLNKEELCLLPTHEEIVTEMLKRIFQITQGTNELICSRIEIKGSKLFQISRKYRNEKKLILPDKGYEFIMFDAYSFDKDKNSANLTYEKTKKAIENILNRLDLKFKLGPQIEKKIFKETSQEILCYAENNSPIEIGHIFKLEDFYSEAFDLRIDKEFASCCSFGLGIDRVINQIIQREKIANLMNGFSYQLALISDHGVNNYYEYTSEQFPVLYYDSPFWTIDEKIMHAKLIGIRNIIVIDNKIKLIKDKEVIVLDDLTNIQSKLR